MRKKPCDVCIISSKFLTGVEPDVSSAASRFGVLYAFYCSHPLSLNKSAHYPLTSLIKKAFLPAELQLTAKYFLYVFCTILCKP